MPYEILNNAQITPHRLHALTRLVARFPGIDRQSVLDMVAPQEVDEKQSTADAVFRAAVHCRLISPDDETSTAFVSIVDENVVKRVDGFREHMRGAMLGVTDETRDNFLFNQYAAWYATQNERVLMMDISDYYNKFNAQMHADSVDRAFNNAKRNGWESWATFLGLGWNLPTKSGRNLMVPDARNRIHALLPILLPRSWQDVPFAEFASAVAEACPELDGGLLFERAWDAGQATARGNQLSLMLSNALRGLHESRTIELRSVADSRDNWTLFPASGFEIQRVNHIRRVAVQ